MKRVTKFGLVAAVVVTLSGLAINKILEKPTLSCVDEVAELTNSTDALGVVLLSPDKETVGILNSAINPTTNVSIGSPYLTVAALGPDALTVYIKVLLEEGKKYSPQAELEVKQIKESMHKDKNKCTMDGKRFEIYRAKTTLSLIQKMSKPI